MAEVCKTFHIQWVTDRVIARMQVRELARSLHFDLREQACISLATYNILCSLGMGTSCEGEVSVSHLQDGKRGGMQIVCTTIGQAKKDITPTSFGDTLSLVDELSVHKNLPNGDCVTIVKWEDKDRLHFHE